MGIYEFFYHKRREWEDRLFIHQKKVFFEWAKEKMNEGEYVVLHLFEEQECYILENEKWKRIYFRKMEHNPKNFRFIFCKKGDFLRLFYCRSEEWQNIFLSGLLEVWERHEFYQEHNQIFPLRLGITNEEKRMIAKETRRMIRDVLRGETPHSHLNRPRFEERQDLDVALWLDGKIRASVIMIGKSCKEALEIGALRATEDYRFRSMTTEELARAKVEITCMSDLALPLTESEYIQNEIDPSKGYRVSFDGRSGWFLPEVHNVIFFPHLRVFLHQLLVEKAKIMESVDINNYYQFEVIDWVETGEDIMDLCGPIPQRKNSNISCQKVKRVSDDAVAWLQSIQNSDGSLPHIISEKGEAKLESLAALGCVGHALASYVNETDNQIARRIAEKIFIYLKENLPVDEEKTKRQNFLALVYFMRFSIALGEKIGKNSIESLFSIRMNSLNPITLLQFLSLIADYIKTGESDYIEFLKRETERVYDLFEEKRELPETQIASFPELVSLLRQLWEITGEGKWKEMALSSSKWYSSKQLKNGAYPFSLLRKRPYSRGTGKVFEVLTCFSEENQDTVCKTFLWLEDMQYQKQDLFWLDEKNQSTLIGGFRHDDFNREAWIDGAAHIILGCARWLMSNR